MRRGGLEPGDRTPGGCGLTGGGVHGVLAVDKPAGLTSHDVVDRVRRLLGVGRVGHAGTLDPAASGVLVLGVGRGARVLRFLDIGEKEYVADFRLGRETSTGDAEGEAVGPDRPVHVARDDVERALAKYRGEIAQVPPMFSALKVRGVPLYRLARRGEWVERGARRVTIYRLETTGFTPPTVTLRMVCSPGTYVRSLAMALGRDLGCGAHVASLRRTRVGAYGLEDAARLAGICADGAGVSESLASRLIPLDLALRHLPSLELTAEEREAVCHGQGLCARRGGEATQLAAGQPLLLVGPRGEVVAIARGSAGSDGEGGSGRLRLACVLMDTGRGAGGERGLAAGEREN